MGVPNFYRNASLQVSKTKGLTMHGWQLTKQTKTARSISAVL
jgi:hypothetical protein